MPWITQMIYFTVLFLGIVLALYISFWVLLAAFAIGIILVVWSHLKDFLIAKGILNPTPGIPPDGIIIDNEPQDGTHETITLIEGDYKRVDSE